MPLITPIRLRISEKLKADKEYRNRFFRGQAEDEIAISIRSLREKRAKRQLDLANESGMKQSAISRIEQSDYCGWTLNTLFRVADALDARLRIVLEPAEIIIEQYEKIEAEASGDYQYAEFHKASTTAEDITNKAFLETPDRQSIIGGSSSLPTFS